MSDPLLKIINLTKEYGRKRKSAGGFLALDHVDFQIAKGEVLSLVGESGSGKSTVARLVSRLMEPTDGKIILNGENVLETEPDRPSLNYRQKVQMIFQDPFASLSPTQPVIAQLTRPMEIHGIATGRMAHNKALDLLALVGLSPAADFAEKLPFEMSGGQRQRVAIARALAVEPTLILADEPTSMLDVSVRIGILNLIDKLRAERGISFLYITHDLASARYVGDRTMVMYAGRIVEEAESRRLMENPHHPYTQLLLASVPDPQSSAQSISSAISKANSGQVNAIGCAFRSRCPSSSEQCATAKPQRVPIGQDVDHYVRCHHATGSEVGIPE